MSQNYYTRTFCDIHIILYYVHVTDVCIFNNKVLCVCQNLLLCVCVCQNLLLCASIMCMSQNYYTYMFCDIHIILYYVHVTDVCIFHNKVLCVCQNLLLCVCVCQNLLLCVSIMCMSQNYYTHTSVTYTY